MRKTSALSSERHSMCSGIRRSSRRQNTVASTRDACATRNFMRHVKQRQRPALLLSRGGPDRQAHAERLEPAPQNGIMLLRQNLRRRHERSLIAASIASRIAAIATTVLPEPTSPCNRRFIGWFAARSRRISAMTLFCASVSSKGSERRNFSSNSPRPQCAAPVRTEDSARRDAINICIAKNSERTRCSRAALNDSQSSGK